MNATTAVTLPLKSLDVENDLHLTAIHESGHAVIYWLMRCPFEFVTAAPTAEYVGFTKPTAQAMTGWDHARIAVAGSVAQAMATFAADPFTDAMPEEAWEAWADHLEGALLAGGAGDQIGLIKTVGSEEFAIELFRSLEYPVHMALTEFWPQVIALAEAIVSHPKLTLTGREAFTVMDATQPAGHFRRLHG